MAPSVTYLSLREIDLVVPLSMNGRRKRTTKISVIAASATGSPASSKADILRIW